MARTKPPSFDFFPDDFIAGTYHLPAEAVGIYVRLLCYQWNNGVIPTEETELARIAGVDADAMRTHMRTVMLKFMPDGCGAMKNARLEREREHKLSVIEKSKQAADTRWAKEKARKEAEALAKLATLGDANEHADAMRTHMLPTSNVQLPTSKDINLSVCADDPNGLIGRDVICPDWLREWFIRWLDWRWQDSGKKPPATLQQTWVLDLSSRGEAKAIADLQFSISKQAKNILRSENDLDKVTKARIDLANRPIGKETAAEAAKRIFGG